MSVYPQCPHPRRTECSTCFRDYTGIDGKLAPRTTPRRLPWVDYWRASGWTETRQWDCPDCGIVLEVVRRVPEPG